jgi:hypothetical protein
MQNGIKNFFSTASLNNFQKGNVNIAVVGNLGPTANTGYYNSITPTPGKYVIIKALNNQPPFFFSPQSDAELIRLAIQEGATGANTGSASSVLNWFTTPGLAGTNYAAISFNYPEIVMDGLVLHYDAGVPFSYPTTNNNWFDMRGIGQNSSLNGNYSYDYSNSGSIVFNSSNTYGVTFGNDPDFNVSDNITIEMWVKLNTTNPAGLGFLRKYNPGYLFYVTDDAAKVFAFDSRNGDGTYYRTTGTTNIQDNVWKCLVAQKSGLYYRVYVNGSLEGTTVANTVGNISSANDIYLGTDQSTYMSGSMGIFRIYNRELSSQEILQNFNAIKGRYGL